MSSHIPVYREELYRRIQEENRQAASVMVEDLDQIIKVYSQEGFYYASDHDDP